MFNSHLKFHICFYNQSILDPTIFIGILAASLFTCSLYDAK
ncbi:hypothetical protein AR1Y2_1929 [Anaerostipes rhamnosivorans]|uniref:Uncharacterized protein n=1 Tax=Anaerostipes rhamnosivorans TaxID=1229621 RepID=A0A4P8IHB8_9FIRM|nr:hypothetical protein AR1Y2_1929 [Anaerostipes rhamnosivorans]